MAGYAEAARLLDGPALRAISLALRGEVDGYDAGAPDPTLVELVESPFESVEGVTDRLSRLETRLRRQGDRRAVFLTIYARMSREVRDAIERGRFADPEWMREYLITFANYYRRAFLAFERGELDAVPDPWRLAFGTAVRGDGLVVQDAFLGVNAHINYDLALAVDDVGIDPNRAQKYADHRVIDDILAGLVDAQQRALARIYAPGIADVDALCDRFDEAITLRSMTEGREQAWRVAVVLTDVTLPPVASYARWLLRATATGGALFVLNPELDSSLMGTLRTIEAEGIDLEAVLERADEAI